MLRRLEKGPDQFGKGSAVHVSFIKGPKAYACSTLVTDIAHRGFDFKFSGNRSSLNYAGTGCVVCLESCPVGVVGNAAYSMREMAKEVT